MTALAVAVAVEAVGVLLVFGATVELHRQVLQLRIYSGLVDDARPIGFNAEADLRHVLDDLADRDLSRTVVLVLSDSCTTCHDIIAHVATVRPNGTVLLIESRSEAEALGWLARYGLAIRDDVIYDNDGLIALALGVGVTPAAVTFEGTRPVAASTVPSTRQFDKLAEWSRDSRSTPPSSQGAKR